MVGLFAGRPVIMVLVKATLSCSTPVVYDRIVIPIVAWWNNIAVRIILRTHELGIAMWIMRGVLHSNGMIMPLRFWEGSQVKLLLLIL